MKSGNDENHKDNDTTDELEQTLKSAKLGEISSP